MRHLAFAFALVLAAALGGAAHADPNHLHEEEGMVSLGAHVHGLAELQIAQDGGTLTFVLDTPGYNLVGFERAAQTAEETAALDRALGLLNRPNLLAAVAGPTGCTASATELQADVFAAADSAPADTHDHSHDHAHDHDHGAGTHAQNVVATWTLTCSGTVLASRLSLGLFALFPRLEAVEVSFLGPAGAVGPARLTPSRPTLALSAR